MNKKETWIQVPKSSKFVNIGVVIVFCWLIIYNSVTERGEQYDKKG